MKTKQTKTPRPRLVKAAKKADKGHGKMLRSRDEIRAFVRKCAG